MLNYPAYQAPRMSAAKKLIKALPVEEEAPEEVVVEDETVEESVEGSVETGEETAEMGPAEMLMARIDAIEDLLAALKKDARKLLKGKLPKRQTNRPKGETPKQVAEWNTFVAETLALMEREGWPEFTTKKGKTVAAGVEVEDKWVFVDEEGNTRPPAYKDALAYAAHLKTETEDPEEKAAAKAAAEAEKIRKREEAKAERAKQREAEKARKAAEKAAEKEAEKERKAAEKAAEKAKADAEKLKAKELATKAVLAKVGAKPVVAAPAKPVVAKPAVAKPAAAAGFSAAAAAAAAKAALAKPANGGAGKSPAAAEKPATKSAAAAAPAMAAAAPAAEETAARKWVFKGKTYFKTPAGDCWVMNSDKSQGPWAGRYDPVADAIDETAEEPEYESDDE